MPKSLRVWFIIRTRLYLNSVQPAELREFVVVFLSFILNGSSITIRRHADCFVHGDLPSQDLRVHCLTRLRNTDLELQRSGHQVLVFAPGNGTSNFNGAVVEAMRGSRFPLYPELTLALPRAFIRQKLLNFKPDILTLPTRLPGSGRNLLQRCTGPAACDFISHQIAKVSPLLRPQRIGAGCLEDYASAPQQGANESLVPPP